MIEVFLLKKRKKSPVVSSDWNALAQRLEKPRRKGVFLGVDGRRAKVKYKLLKQYIHTDLITLYTGICLHIQMCLNSLT